MRFVEAHFINTNRISNVIHFQLKINHLIWNIFTLTIPMAIKQHKYQE